MFTTKCLRHRLLVSALSLNRNYASNLENKRQMDLRSIVTKLNDFAPLKLAASWDNVGLLVEPSDNQTVSHVMLTNDLTLKVTEEAIEKKVNMIISYHPPIFSPLKRLTQLSWKETIAVKCLENKIAIYSPHTCWDVVKGGTNDWLISPFVGKVNPISNHKEQKYKVLLSFKPSSDMVSRQNVIEKVNQFQFGDTVLNESSITVSCSKNHLRVFDEFSTNCSIELQEVDFLPHSGYGEGRLVRLDVPMKLKDVLTDTKKHLKMDKVKLAMGYQLNEDSLVTSIAVCAGSGSSVLKGVDADVLITGEMSHHEVLDVCHQRKGTSAVILCGHSNTERGFLDTMLEYLRKGLNNSVQISISKTDSDPLKIV